MEGFSMSTSPIDLSASFGKNLSALNKFCQENNLKITDTNGDGIFDVKDKVEYSVQAGDTMSKIARRYEGCSLKQLTEANQKQYPNANSIKPGDSIMIPLHEKEQKVPASSTTPAKLQPKVKKEDYKFETHDFGNIKTRKIVDKEIQKLLKGQKVDSLKDEKYYVEDKNGNGIFDEGEGLYKQVSVMLDAGHDSRLKGNQKVAIPGKSAYTTKENDSWESIAKAQGVNAEQLRKANYKTVRSKDPGALGEEGGLNEADITGIARDELAKKLSANGFDVILAERTDRAHLKERQIEKLEKNPDMYISLHCDGSDNKSVNGESVQYNPANSKDESFAKIVNKHLKKDTTIPKNRGAEKRVEGKNGLCVLNNDREGRIAESLVEFGFITNADDRSKLINAESRKKITDAVANACLEQYNTHKVK